MWDGQRAFDIVGYCFTGCVRDVVDGQDYNVVSDAHAAVFAAVGFDGHVGVFGCHLGRSLPAFRFAIVGVDMPPFGDVRDDLTDVLAVLDGGIAVFEILQRDLVADGNVSARRQAES